jgi:hypothetical protein
MTDASPSTTPRHVGSLMSERRSESTPQPSTPTPQTTYPALRAILDAVAAATPTTPGTGAARPTGTSRSEAAMSDEENKVLSNVEHVRHFAEQWRPVPEPEFSDYYEVSNHYQVRTIEQLIMRSNGYPQTIRARIRRLRDRRGGQSVTLVHDGQRRSFFVHKLVEAAFGGEP